MPCAAPPFNSETGRAARLAQDVVPVAQFRERYLHLRSTGQITPTVFAIKMHMWRRPPKRRSGERIPDVGQVSRMLGLRPYSAGSRRGKLVRVYVNYATAVRLAAALDMDPHEAGL